MYFVSRLRYHGFCTWLSVAHPTAAALKTLISGLFKEKNIRKLVVDFKTASKYFRFRKQNHIYEVTIRRLASAQHFSLIEEILEDQKKYYDITREGFAIRLIFLYGKSGMFDHASKTFDQLPDLKCDRTVKSFNALLTACVDSKNFDKLEKLFRQLPSKLLITPDEYSYNIIIRAFCEMGSLDSAVSMLDEMEKNGLRPTLVTFNTLLNAFYKGGRFSDGEKIWARMEQREIVPDIRSFNAKLRGLVYEGKTSEAVKLVEELWTRELKPDVFSYSALIEGYCNDGNLEEAKKIFAELLKSDCVPIRSTFELLIPCLCANGDFDLALKLCKESMRCRCFIDAGLLQIVVNGLVRESKFQEAKKLVELARSKRYSPSILKMPSDED